MLTFTGIEIVEKKRTVLFQMILLNCYTCGLIIMPFIAWAVPYWRHFLRVLYAPTLLVLTYSFFLDESIRWLFSKGKRGRGIKLIKKIAHRNGVDLDKAILNKLDYVNENTSNVINDRKLLLKTFKSKIMMQRFLVCLVWWFTITLINYGMMIGSVFIDGNKYINFALLMLMDIPSNVFYWLALSKYKRKLPLISSFIVGGIFCVLQPFTPKGKQLNLYLRFKNMLFDYPVDILSLCSLCRVQATRGWGWRCSWHSKRWRRSRTTSCTFTHRSFSPRTRATRCTPSAAPWAASARSLRHRRRFW